MTNSNTQDLVGFIGDSYRTGGYFFCPFVPLTITPPVLDQRDWTPNPNLQRYSQANFDAGQQLYGILTFTNFVEEPREKVNWMKEGF